MKLFNLSILILLLSSIVLAADLSDFPYNYLEGSKKSFAGKIVVGEDAMDTDLKVAQSLQTHLIKNFDLIEDKLEIIYAKNWKNQNSIHISKDLELLSFGKNLGNFRDFNINKSDSNLLKTETLKLKKSTDYTQHLIFEDNGLFEERYESNGFRPVLVFNDSNLITYEIRLADPLDVKDLTEEDIIGKSITFMDNEFIILKGWRNVLTSFAGTFEKLVLIRTSETYLLSENESKIIKVGEETYDIKVESIDERKVNFLINKKKYSVNLQESNFLGDVSIGVLDIEYSLQDNVSRSYVKFVIGDIELQLEDAQEILINGVFASEVLDGYTIYSTFDSEVGKGWSGLKLTYRLTENVTMHIGDSFEDTFFNTFRIVFEYSNYNNFKNNLDDLRDFISADVVLQLGKRGTYMYSTYINHGDIKEKTNYLAQEGYKIINLTNFTKSDIIYEPDLIFYDNQIENMSNISNVISVGGPAVNKVTAKILNLTYPTYESASGVSEGQGVIRYFENINSIVVYGYDEVDTASIANKLKRGNLTGLVVKIN